MEPQDIGDATGQARVPSITPNYLQIRPKKRSHDDRLPRDWTAIHWPDSTPADAARWIAVLPLAATEQHGPHLPLDTDVLIAEAYLARVRELLPAEHPRDLPARCSRSAFPPSTSIIRARRRCRPRSR